MPLQAKTTQRALELTRTRGYTLQEWLWGLNVGPKSHSQLIQASQVLEEVKRISISMKPSDNSSRSG